MFEIDLAELAGVCIVPIIRGGVYQLPDPCQAPAKLLRGVTCIELPFVLYSATTVLGPALVPAVHPACFP